MVAALSVVGMVVPASGLTAEPSPGRSGLSISASPRWGADPPFAWTSYVVTIHNEGPSAVVGEVVLSPEADGASTSTNSDTVASLRSSPAMPGTGLERLRQVWPLYRYRVEIGSGDTRRLEALIVEAPFGHRVELRDARGRVLAAAPGTGAGRGSWSLAVLGRIGADRIKQLGAGYEYSSQVHVTVLPSATDLPEDALGFTGLQAILVDDFDTGSLSAGQRQALRDFVALGGSLVIAGGPPAARNIAGLPSEIVPLQPSGTTEVALGPLAELGGQSSTATAPVATGRLDAGRVILGSGGTPLIIEQDYGSGHVVQLTYDPLQPPFSTDPSVGGIGLEQGLGRAFSQASVRDTASADVSPSNLWSALFNPPNEGPRPWPKWPTWAIAVTILYCATAGPILWLVAGHRRPPGSIGTLVLAAFCVLIASVVLAGKARGPVPTDRDDVVGNTVQIRTAGPDGVELRNRLVALYAPGVSNLSTSLASRGVSTLVAQPKAEGDGLSAGAIGFAQNVGEFKSVGFASPRSNGYRRAAEIEASGDKGMIVRTPPGRPGRPATFQTLDLDHGAARSPFEAHLGIVPMGAADQRLPSRTGRVQGTITNRTGRPMRSVNVRAASGAGGYVTDTLNPGETVAVGSAEETTMISRDPSSKITAAAAAWVVPRAGQIAISALEEPDERFVPGSRPGTALAIVAQILPIESDSALASRPARMVSGAYSKGTATEVFEIASIPMTDLAYVRSTGPAEVWDWEKGVWRPVSGGGISPPSPPSDALRSSEVDDGLVRVRVRHSVDRLSEPGPTAVVSIDLGISSSIDRRSGLPSAIPQRVLSHGW